MAARARQNQQRIGEITASIEKHWGLSNASEAIPQDLHPNGVSEVQQWDLTILQGIEKIAGSSISLAEFQSKLREGIQERIRRNRSKAGKVTWVTMTDINFTKRFFREHSERPAVVPSKGKTSKARNRSADPYKTPAANDDEDEEDEEEDGSRVYGRPDAITSPVAPIKYPGAKSPQSPVAPVPRGKKRKNNQQPLEEEEEDTAIPTNDGSPVAKKSKAAAVTVLEEDPTEPSILVSGWADDSNVQTSTPAPPSRLETDQVRNPHWVGERVAGPSPSGETGAKGSPLQVHGDETGVPAVGVGGSAPSPAPAPVVQRDGAPSQIGNAAGPLAGLLRECGINHDMPSNATTADRVRLLEIHLSVERTRYLLEEQKIVLRGEVEEDQRKTQDGTWEVEARFGAGHLVGGGVEEGEVAVGVEAVRERRVRYFRE